MTADVSKTEIHCDEKRSIRLEHNKQAQALAQFLRQHNKNVKEVKEGAPLDRCTKKIKHNHATSNKYQALET